MSNNDERHGEEYRSIFSMNFLPARQHLPETSCALFSTCTMLPSHNTQQLSGYFSRSVNLRISTFLYYGPRQSTGSGPSVCLTDKEMPDEAGRVVDGMCTSP